MSTYAYHVVPRYRTSGFTLIELMIAMVLGLLVLGAAFSIFLSSQRAYQASQGLGRIQESSQVAFEMMARDLREAGASPCDSTKTPANIVTGWNSLWYANWAESLKGYDSNGLSGQVAGTDALELVRTGDDAVTTTAAGISSFTYTPARTYAVGELLIVCDSAVFGIFKAGSPSANSVDIASGTNDCTYLPQPNAGVCAGSATQYTFPKFSMITPLQGVRWLVRDPDGDATNGYSLYRQVNGGNAEEVIEGVVDLQLSYLRNGAYVDASAITNATEWREVRAVRIRLTLRETEAARGGSTNGQPIQRTVEHTVALRNRVL